MSVYSKWAPFICLYAVCGPLLMSVHGMCAPSYISVQYLGPLLMLVHSMWAPFIYQYTACGPPSYASMQYVGPFLCRCTVCVPLHMSEVTKLSTVSDGCDVQMFLNEVVRSYLIHSEHERGYSSHTAAETELQILQQEIRVQDILYTFKKAEIIIMYCITHMSTCMNRSVAFFPIRNIIISTVFRPHFVNMVQVQSKFNVLKTDTASTKWTHTKSIIWKYRPYRECYLCTSHINVCKVTSGYSYCIIFLCLTVFYRTEQLSNTYFSLSRLCCSRKWQGNSKFNFNIIIP
jgi:hypothetical protein